MSYILRLREVTPENYPVIGSIAKNLVLVNKIGLPTSTGFCITTNSFKSLLVNLKGEIDKVINEIDRENKVQRIIAAKKVQDLIMVEEISYGIQNDILKAYSSLNLNIDVYKTASADALNIIKAGRESPLVAIRASVPKKNNLVLYAKGNNELINCIKKIWCDFVTEENLSSLLDLEIPLLVQKVLNPDKSGYLIPSEKTTIKICFGFNHEEQTYDTYLIDKNSFEILNKVTRKQAWLISRDPYFGGNIKKDLPDYKSSLEKLDSYEIMKLVKIGNYLKDNFVTDVEVEFNIERDNIYIMNISEFDATSDEGFTDQIEEEFKHEENTILLKGINAYPGVVTGKVKIGNSESDLENLNEDFILVCSHINGLNIQNKKIIGIITDDETNASVNFTVPTVISTNGATSILKENQLVTIDGVNGVVCEAKSNMSFENEDYETVTEIKINVSEAEDLDKFKFDGIGLFRSEQFLIKRGIHPFEFLRTGKREELVNNLVEDLTSVARLAKNKTIWYRTFDALSTDFKKLQGGNLEPDEENPLLGWRSIRRDLNAPELLKVQFEAIKKVQESGYPNIGVMIPMVSDVSQIKEVKGILKEVGLEPQEEIDFGVLIETPAAVQMMKNICKIGLDFICIGLHDLAQLTLGVDMKNPKVAKWFDVMHPAVLHQILYTIKVCREYNIETSVAGDFSGKTELVEWLISEGIESVSTEPKSLEEVRNAVTKAEKKMLLKVARTEGV